MKDEESNSRDDVNSMLLGGDGDEEEGCCCCCCAAVEIKMSRRIRMSKRETRDGRERGEQIIFGTCNLIEISL